MSIFFASLFFVCAALAAAFAAIASAYTDFLYKENPAILSFPADIERRGRFRLPFLAVAFALFLFATGLSAANLPLFLFKNVVAIFMLVVICTDFEQQVIFDKIMLPFVLLSLPFFLAGFLPVADHVLAAVLAGGAFLILAIITKGGIGGGDIKLIFALGLYFGSSKLLSIIICATVLGGFAAVFALLFGETKRGEYIAYGPYFAATALLFAFLTH